MSAVRSPHVDLPQLGFDRMGGGRELGAAGFLVDDDFFGAAPPPAGSLKVFNGTAWVAATAKRWDGSTWATAAVKRFDGGAWQGA